MRASSLFFMGLTALTVGVGACAASPPAERVQGAYLATEAGDISKLTFADATHYSMVLAACADGPICTEEGTYKLDASAGTIAFTDEATGKTSTMPFAAVAPEVTPSGATTQGSSLASGGDDGGGIELVTDTSQCLAADVFVPSFTAGKQKFKGGSPCAAKPPVIVSSFLIPSAEGEDPVIDAIDGAHSSIRMIMFHLTNPAVVTALVAAAKRKVDVQIILDQGNLMSHTPASITAPLAKAKIKVIPSSTAFAITHVKSLVIDNSTALISSMNLTMTFGTTRDYGVVTTDDVIIKEFLSVFAADVTNAKNETDKTPKLTSPYTAWSPVNSESRLAAFVKSAKKTLVATSENLGDAEIQAAMIAAAKAGVEVRVIAPLCDDNPNPLFDLPYLAKLEAGGVQARAMPTPATASVPYMHAKMMIADGTSAYVGSINFSTSSTTKSRELGIFFTDAPTISTISETFEADWAKAVKPPAESSAKCPTAG